MFNDILSFQGFLRLLRPNIGRRLMHEKYESGLIRNEHEFKEVLNNVLSDSERS